MRHQSFGSRKRKAHAGAGLWTDKDEAAPDVQGKAPSETLAVWIEELRKRMEKLQLVLDDGDFTPTIF